MSGLLERITQRPVFQRNPGRASWLIHDVVSGMVSHPDRRLRLASSPRVGELVIRASSVVPQAVFGVLFMCCDCPPGNSSSGTIDVSDDDIERLGNDIFHGLMEGTNTRERQQSTIDALKRFDESHR